LTPHDRSHLEKYAEEPARCGHFAECQSALKIYAGTSIISCNNIPAMQRTTPNTSRCFMHC